MYMKERETSGCCGLRTRGLVCDQLPRLQSDMVLVRDWVWVRLFVVVPSDRRTSRVRVLSALVCLYFLLSSLWSTCLMTKQRMPRKEVIWSMVTVTKCT